MKYTKKPITIEAIRLQDNPKSIYDVECFIEQKESLDTSSSMAAMDRWDTYVDILKSQGGRIIKTLEGEHLASFGDYIIRGVKGEYYPCKPDIFAMTYEEAYPVADKMKEHGLTNFELFQVERAKIILNMLDNPDHGIYPTTQAFKEIDRAYKAFLRNGCIMFGADYVYHVANPNTKMDVPSSVYETTEKYYDNNFKPAGE